MSLLPTGQSLDRVLPDLDDLLVDPQRYLREAPLVIGPRRMYGLACLFAIPGLALLISCVVQNVADGERIAMGVGLLIGASIWAGWSLLMSGHELVLYHDHVEFIHQGVIIRAPWALFYVQGRPFVPDSDSPFAGLTLPIDPSAIGWVEQLRPNSGEAVIASGKHVSGPQWQFNLPDEVVLPARYEVAAGDIGELLLLLGGKLGREKPLTPPPGEGPEDSPIVTVQSDGWMVIPLTRLQFPPCCARCCGPRDDTLTTSITPREDWAFGFVARQMRTVPIRIPLCEPCKNYLAELQRRNSTLGMALGAVLGAAAGAITGGYAGEGQSQVMLLGAFFGLFLGLLIGMVIGTTMFRNLPVRFKRYIPSRGIVSVKCENPDIAERLRAMSQMRRQEPGQPEL
jgi:hypothetical protein